MRSSAVRLFRRPGRRVWVHARLLEKTPRRSVSDVDIYNEDGRLAARVRGLRSHRVAGGREESLDDLLYAYQWRPQPRSEADIAAGTGQLADLRGQRRHRRAARRAAPGSWRCLHRGPRRLDFRGLRPGTITGSIPAGRKTCCGSSRPSSGPINRLAAASSTCGTSTRRRRTG